MSSKVIHAFYDDDDVLFDAVKDVKAANHHIEEVFTPFPVLEAVAVPAYAEQPHKTDCCWAQVGKSEKK